MMICKFLIAFVILQVVFATLQEEEEYTLGVELHQRAPIPGALVPLPIVDAPSSHLHLSVNTGTPGVWYVGKVRIFI